MAATYVNTPNESVSAQALTEAAPTLDTEGFSVSAHTGYQLVVAAASGQTLSGAGALRCFVYDLFVHDWARCPDFDWTVPAGAASFRWCASKVFPNVTPRKGQISYIANGVTVSAGTIVVYILAYPRGAAFAKV